MNNNANDQMDKDVPGTDHWDPLNRTLTLKLTDDKTIIDVIELKGLLEKAKELLIRDKMLVPVLFVQTEEQLYISALAVDFNKIDKREMMVHIGREFAKKRQKLLYVSFICEVNISKIANDKLEKSEAILVSKLNAVINKKELMVQEYENSNGDITFKGGSQELINPKIFLIDAFIEGYEKMNLELGSK